MRPHELKVKFVSFRLPTNLLHVGHKFVGFGSPTNLMYDTSSVPNFRKSHVALKFVGELTNISLSSRVVTHEHTCGAGSRNAHVDSKFVGSLMNLV